MYKRQFEQLRQFNATPSWLFGHIGYEFKNEVEELPASKVPHIDFGIGFFFEPEHLIRFSNGILFIESSAQKPTDIFQQISAIPVSYTHLDVYKRQADILDGLDELKVCESYEINGKQINTIPFQMNKVDIKPQYRSFNGWKTDITAIANYDQMPEEMKVYINFLNKWIGVLVNYISNDPGREQIVTV